MASVWPLYRKRPNWWRTADGCSSGRFSHLHRGTLELCQSDHRVLGHLPDRLLSLAGQPALGRVLVVPNFFHLRIMEATVFLGTFNVADIFWYPSPDLCLDTILSRSSTDNSFDLMAWFLLWYALSTVGPYVCTGVCLSKSCPINWIYHRWTPIKL